jgi:hypothetical protein
MDLDFVDPVNYKDFRDNHGYDANHPGIYIWGFYDNNNQFIPYYAGKIEDSIYSRINGHFKKIREKNTYTIFKSNVYQNLSNYLCYLPREAKPYQNLCSNQKFIDQILYLNNCCFLYNEYKSKVNPSNLALLKKELKSQSLDELLVDFNPKEPTIQQTINCEFSDSKLCITYATIEELKKENGWEARLRIAETCVKFCLKTNTMGDSQSLKSVKSPIIKISSKNSFLSSSFYHAINGKQSIDIPKSIYYGFL